ncbi:MAG: hypothetical protein WKG07_25395 [Hymenobacter sp.]
MSDGFLHQRHARCQRGRGAGLRRRGWRRADRICWWATRPTCVNGYYRASIYLLPQRGHAPAAPVFELVTERLPGPGRAGRPDPPVRFESLRPTLADLNRDGALDLVYSVY